MSDVLLVGVDGSETSDRAAAFALERAQASGASVVVAHVVPWSPFQATTIEENEQRHPRREAELRSAREQVVAPVVEWLRAGGVAAEGVAQHGHPAQTLCDLAEQHQVSHLVVGRTGEGRVRSQLFGSLPASLVQISPVPVTVVP